MNPSKALSYRSEVVDSIDRHLFGPADGIDELVAGKPFWRYLAGILFPSHLHSSLLAAQIEEPSEDAGSSDEGVEDPAVAAAYEALPSSMGITFYVESVSGFDVFVEAGRYVEVTGDGKRDLWKRVAIFGPEKPERVHVAIPRKLSEVTVLSESVLEGRGRLHVVLRPFGEGLLATTTLMNVQSAEDSNPQRQVEEILFQCRFRVDVTDGKIAEYPSHDRYSIHDEDEELAFTYRSKRSFGIGHGCAASWDETGRVVSSISAEPLPRVEVKGLTNEIQLPDDVAVALNIAWLADSSVPASEVARTLTAFVDEYESWHARERANAVEAHPSDRETCRRILERQERAITRMRMGIIALTAGPDSDALLRAFRIAQQAMLVQFSWTREVRGRSFEVGESPLAKNDLPLGSNQPSATWRAFQLAFQLLAIESISNPTSSDRNTLDLLWFPTGGGKTEAYLSLAAFEIALRRIRNGDAGAGTAVLMRYTLRLLTSQQFERCAKVISAMECLRRARPESDLGDVPVNLGLWIGGDTPNRLSGGEDTRPGAVTLFEALLEADEPENPFRLLACPACGTKIVPRRKSTERGDYGLEVTPTAFRMWCPDARCVLHSGIPVSVVDEDLYNRPPSLVVGTIDKFARMVWEPRAKALLGLGTVTMDDGETTEVLPPSLVIQDELHLINGPLGTIAGMYEAAIDAVIAQQGVDLKYLAATATIQRAHEQCRSLYAREASLFPPPGLDVRDSFFTREDQDSPGRLFVGAMNSGVYTSLTTLVQASASAAQAVQELAERATTSDDALAIDSYWTQVVYHNSRQELGKTTTLLRDDVLTRLRSLTPEGSPRKFERIVELSGNLRTGVEVSRALDDLTVEWPSDAAIDVLACTNMISVGIDVERLGLMIVKGQPKTTAEYIQATSRVGRHARRPPGIVLTLYTSTRPRDRSHFETFQQYHAALYRAVEPSTVTPFALPAIARTLHAAIVMAARQVCGLDKPEQAREFTPDDPDTNVTLGLLRARIQRACPEDHWQGVSERFDQIVAAWHEATVSSPGLRFEQSRQFPYLLQHAPGVGWSISPPWPTLNSLRHVDGESPVRPITGWAG